MSCRIDKTRCSREITSITGKQLPPTVNNMATQKLIYAVFFGRRNTKPYVVACEVLNLKVWSELNASGSGKY
ncbi:hypothetical protein DC094_16200 [Pelagibaculum spongiae]|uniref:Uncharacterized protein n=1 Tax=Pelagibaculum spongiae TaxID=2080658 RepID=A0A2V1GV73_9GAMM|nr:hypothetical protein DC094_16200 [Pelagibaculum spongiae]